MKRKAADVSDLSPSESVLEAPVDAFANTCQERLGRETPSIHCRYLSQSYVFSTRMEILLSAVQLSVPLPLSAQERWVWGGGGGGSSTTETGAVIVRCCRWRRHPTHVSSSVRAR